jgi:hypothetical protein
MSMSVRHDIELVLKGQSQQLACLTPCATLSSGAWIPSLESRAQRKLHARFGGGRRKRPVTDLAFGLPYMSPGWTMAAFRSIHAAIAKV